MGGAEGRWGLRVALSSWLRAPQGRAQTSLL